MQGRGSITMIPALNTSAEKSSERLAWDETHLADPHSEADKAQRINAMFDAIAESYDLNNRLHSLWRDQAWRRKAVRLAHVNAGEDVVVDVACGTGDLALAFARGGAAKVIGIDFVPRMIRLAQEKAAKHVFPAAPEFRVGDAMNLDLPDACCDIVSIAFGIRNVADPLRAMREFRRILRPGGRLVILEFSTPPNPLMRAIYNFYSHSIMPRTATWISRDRTGAYKYLPRSVDTFATRERMVEMMESAGFIAEKPHSMTLGICAAYLGRVAETSG